MSDAPAQAARAPMRSLGERMHVALPGRRALPWILFAASGLAALGLSSWLPTVSAVGFAELRSHRLRTPVTTKVSRVLVPVGVRVARGTPLFELDRTPLEMELEKIRVERRLRAAELEVGLSTVASRETARHAEIDSSAETRKALLAEARAKAATARVEFEQLERRLEEKKSLFDRKLIERAEFEELALRHEVSRAEVRSRGDLVARLEELAARAESRRGGAAEGLEAPLSAQADAELALLDLRERTLTRELAALQVVAPTDGEVTELLTFEDALVETHEPLAVFTEATTPTKVTLCLDEGASALRAGSSFVGTTPEGEFEGRVSSVSTLTTARPERCAGTLGTSKSVRLAQADVTRGVVRPGTNFTARFSKEGTPALDSPLPKVAALPEPLPPDAPMKQPAPLLVPDTLAARTRLEPSGAVYAKELDRYLVLSDDTGLEKGAEDLPWLFVLDRDGRFDPEPLPIEGLAAVKDLESLAVDESGRYFALSSQTASRRGKRSAEREAFVSFRLSGSRAHVEHVRAFRPALTRLAPEKLRSLGISDIGALEIEGMTIEAGGAMLLGLKTPLSPEKKALVWRLRNPAGFLATGELEADALELAFDLELTLIADGRPRGGGVSELLALPNGDLVIACTASGDEPGAQEGRVLLRTASGELRALARYPGRKPEALALEPTRRELLVLFDEGELAPHFTWLSW